MHPDVAPPMPFDDFPPFVRYLGRPTVGEAWKACYEAGRAVGDAIGYARCAGQFGVGILVLLSIAVAIIAAILLSDQLRRRDQR